MSEFKIVHDTVHGSIKLERYFLELMETQELQRLNGIKQLGLAYLVFPGANHTRIEHSMGTGYVAGRLANALGLSHEERDTVTASGLLHDVGHGPFSHTLESVLHHKLKIDHMEVTKGIITGEYDIIGEERDKLGGDTVPEIIERHGLDTRTVAELITGGTGEYGVTTLDTFFAYHKEQMFFSEGKIYLPQIIHSAVDSDQIDYLLRDSHYTGVAHGVIDLDRILQTVEVFNNDLVINKKGISAIEGMLVARGLMYSSVYFHKTVRISELMMARAVEMALDREVLDVQKMTDTELIEWLKRVGGPQEMMVFMLKYRRLYKKVYARGADELSDDERKVLLELADFDKRKAKEDRICAKAGAPEGSVIVDIPLPELLLSEPRIGKTEIRVLDDGTVKSLSNFSPLAKALRIRNVSDWVVMVSAHPKYREPISDVVDKVLFE